jgi:hypothetical protein
MSMARKNNDASKTAGAVEVCCRVLGPNIIMHLDENNGLISLHCVRGLWCYIEMRTPSSGKTLHRFEEDHDYTEIKFETLDELQKNISLLFYGVS